MSQQPETATVVRLSSITPELVARKLRVAGRLFTYIADSSTLLIADGENALFVDVSLCLSPWQSYLWLQENNGTLFALGYLEQVQDPIPLPTLPHHARPTAVDPYLVLSALVVDHVPDLDLELWNSVAERTEQLRLKVEPRDGGSTAVAATPASTGNPPAIQNVDPLPASKQMPMPDCSNTPSDIKRFTLNTSLPAKKQQRRASLVVPHNLRSRFVDTIPSDAAGSM